MGKSYLDERIHASIHFSLTAIDTPERRERIISDVRKAIGDTQFDGVITIDMDGEPLISTCWINNNLMVWIVKPEPETE